MRENKKLIMIGSVAVVALVIVSVAFAALASNLNISFGNVTQTALTWDIGFDDSDGSIIPGVASGTGDVGLSCGTATINGTTVTVSDSTLSKPGDRCSYELIIKNTGDIAGKLSSITPTQPTSTSCSTASGSTMICGKMKYVLSELQDGTYPLDAVGDDMLIINPNSVYSFYLVSIYNSEELNETAVTQSGAKFTLTYQQSEEFVIEQETED